MLAVPGMRSDSIVPDGTFFGAASVAMIKKLTLRERNKRDKKMRIQKAARKLFVQKGFNGTTTREIAELADVGLSTLFLYATDKLDLLFLVYNDDLDTLNKEAFKAIPTDSPFVEQILHVWGFFYRYFTTIPDVSRTLLKEIIFFSQGKQCRRFQEIRLDVIVRLSELVERAKANGEIQSPKNAYHVSEVVFFLFAVEVRYWLANDKHPDPKLGLERLAESMEILMAGLEPRPAVAASTGA